jgi:four helix bundle protein
MKENVVKDKSMAFAVRIINLYRDLCEKRKEYVMSKQVLRAGTSIGANMAEAECAISRNDFLAKVYIAFKECSETKYWLELLLKTEFITSDEYTSIYNDCDEIYKILSSITKTTREKN